MQENQTMPREGDAPRWCECCGRDSEEQRGALQNVEEKAWLCPACGVMYQSLWRVEQSPVTPNVVRFLAEVQNGTWEPRQRPGLGRIFEELARRAREGN